MNSTKKICVVCQSDIDGQKMMYCSNKCKQKHHYHRVKEQTNTYHSQTIRALKRKSFLIEKFGGKCTVCGYDKNIAALHFHHNFPVEKSFELDMRSLSNRKLDSILKESEKCTLLCSNCHSELHNPELEFQNVKKIIAGATQQ